MTALAHFVCTSLFRRTSSLPADACLQQCAQDLRFQHGQTADVNEGFDGIMQLSQPYKGVNGSVATPAAPTVESGQCEKRAIAEALLPAVCSCDMEAGQKRWTEST